MNNEDKPKKATKAQRNDKRATIWPVRHTGAVGRPRMDLTEEMIQKVESYIRAGNYAETAIAAAGISKDVYLEWLRRGAKGEEPYKEFNDRVNKAYAEAEVSEVALLARASQDAKHWQAAAWKLERRAWQRWAKKDQLQLSGSPNGEPIKVEHSQVWKIGDKEIKF